LEQGVLSAIVGILALYATAHVALGIARQKRRLGSSLRSLDHFIRYARQVGESLELKAGGNSVHAARICPQSDGQSTEIW